MIPVSCEKKEIGTLFDRIASHYDLLNHVLSFGMDRLWIRKTIRKIRPCKKLLDVACGTGELAIRILHRHKAEKVIGTDISRKMLQIGERKIAQKKLKNITLQYGDVHDLPYDDATFDTVTCAYGIRNFSQLDKGLSEMCRVLKADGQLLVLELSRPQSRLFGPLYDFYFSKVMPLIGRWVSGDAAAYTYLYRSVMDFAQNTDVPATLAAAGFRNIHQENLTGGIAVLYTATK